MWFYDMILPVWFVFFAVFPVGLAQGCVDDGDCVGNLCCKADGSCSSNDAGSVLFGADAEDVCECATGVFEDSLGVCVDCTSNSDCTEPNEDCCPRRFICEIDGSESSTLNCECTLDFQCTGDTCCTEGGVCSSNDGGSIATGQPASGECECASGLFDEGLGQCVECTENGECPDGDICCQEKYICEPAGPDGLTSNACGDPHMTGFYGQKFDFTGKDGGWYALVSDPPMLHLNMRVTAPIPSLPAITYITGLSIRAADDNGVEHSVVIFVKEPYSLDSACPKEASPCLADGSLVVVLDGEETMMTPGTVALAPGMQVSAVNIPGECRSFGFETYWEKKKQEAALSGRRLSETLGMDEWILADPTATNMVECTEYVLRAADVVGGLFTHQSEHASFQIVTPAATIRLSHGRLHQLPMRDPTNQFNLPDHLTWQMNLAIDHTLISHDARGILGETFVPTRDADGAMIMQGLESIRGKQEDYAVESPLDTSFAMDSYNF